MKLKTHLEFDLVAIESEDRLSLLLELTAPPAPKGKQRAPSALQVVLDRSGSMGGGRLAAAQGALDRLVGRLDPRDQLGVVCFDDEVSVVVPSGPVADKAEIRRRVRSIGPGGMTNLSSGYLRGIQEARRAANGAGATLLLLSDGLANQGVTDHGKLEGIARQAHAHRIATSTLGVGLGYDEALMAAVARGGSGNALFAEEADTAGALIAGEVEGLLSQTVQAASLVVRPKPPVEGIALMNDLPAQAIEGGVMVELGDLYADEQRKLLLSFDVPAMPALGLAQIAELELTYVELPALESHTVTVPVHVNVVPGDQAAGRIADPKVRSEHAFQRAQEAKRQAAERLRDGLPDEAGDLYRQAGAQLSAACPEAPADMQDELRDEAMLLDDLAGRAAFDDAGRLSKATEMDRAYKARKRGRRRPPDGN